MSRKYWKTRHQEALTRFIRSTDPLERNRIFDRELSPALYQLANRAQTSLNLRVNSGHSQDIVIHLLYKAMPNLTEEKLQGALAYLFTSATNYIRSYILVKPKYNILNIDEIFNLIDFDEEKLYPVLVYEPSEEPVNLEADQELEELQKKIIDELDRRIRAQGIMNATNGVYLLLLKDYLLENDFDIREFGHYARKNMHMSLNTYRSVSGRINVATFEANRMKL